MAIPQTRSLRILSRPGSAAPTKTQQRFNSLIKKVEQLKRALQSWSRELPGLHQRVAEHQRRLADYHVALAELVRMFDQLYTHPSLNRRERATLRDIICDTACELLQGGADDADGELKQIYNRHSRGDYDAEAADASAIHTEVMKTILEDGFGMDFRGSQISSLDELERAAAEQLGEAARDAEAHRQAAAARAARRKKSPRQVASEQRRAAEAAQVGKALQDIYRKLARLLHPDHEQDPEERARKTLLMQEVNVAYDRKDLLQLLELQLRFERVDEAQVSSIAEDRLIHFNTLLAEQARQLQHELATVETPWRMQLDLPPSAKLTPARVQAALQADLRGMANSIAQARRDCAQLADPRKLKAWLQRARAAEAAAQAAEDRMAEAWYIGR